MMEGIVLNEEENYEDKNHNNVSGNKKLDEDDKKSENYENAKNYMSNTKLDEDDKKSKNHENHNKNHNYVSRRGSKLVENDVKSKINENDNFSKNYENLINVSRRGSKLVENDVKSKIKENDNFSKNYENPNISNKHDNDNTSKNYANPVILNNYNSNVSKNYENPNISNKHDNDNTSKNYANPVILNNYNSNVSKNSNLDEDVKKSKNHENAKTYMSNSKLDEDDKKSKNHENHNYVPSRNTKLDENDKKSKNNENENKSKHSKLNEKSNISDYLGDKTSYDDNNLNNDEKLLKKNNEKLSKNKNDNIDHPNPPIIHALKTKKTFIYTNNNLNKEKVKEIEHLNEIFLKETEEINDLIIIDRYGYPIFVYSRNKIFDENYIMKNLYDYIQHPEKSILELEKEYSNLNEYLYENGIQLMKRKFVVTRLNLPFVFARDLTFKEELAVIKSRIDTEKILIILTYFPQFTAPLVISYLKEFLPLHDRNLRIDDEFNRFL